MQKRKLNRMKMFSNIYSNKIATLGKYYEFDAKSEQNKQTSHELFSPHYEESIQ